jgi:hypothetical protein
MSGPLTLAQRHLRTFKVAGVAIFIIKVTFIRFVVILGYGNVKFFIRF